MKLKKSITVTKMEGVPGIRKALGLIGPNATYDFVTGWTGWGNSERQETTGIIFEWEEEV